MKIKSILSEIEDILPKKIRLAMRLKLTRLIEQYKKEIGDSK